MYKLRLYACQPKNWKHNSMGLTMTESNISSPIHWVFYYPSHRSTKFHTSNLRCLWMKSTVYVYNNLLTVVILHKNADSRLLHVYYSCVQQLCHYKAHRVWPPHTQRWYRAFIIVSLHITTERSLYWWEYATINKYKGKVKPAYLCPFIIDFRSLPLFDTHVWIFGSESSQGILIILLHIFNLTTLKNACDINLF